MKHLNKEHAPDWGEAWLRNFYTNMVLRGSLGLKVCSCGDFYQDNQYGRSHLTNCNVRSAVRSVASMRPGEEKAMPDGLESRPIMLEVTREGDRVRMGEIWYKVEERGHKIGTDTMCCFYLSATPTPTRAEQLKKQL